MSGELSFEAKELLGSSTSSFPLEASLSSATSRTPARLQERFGPLAISEEDPTQIFQLRKLLGKGSFGFVYHAFDTRQGMDVAIKMISLTEDGAIDDVVQEIATLRDCKDVHIIQYFGSYFRDESLWIVMEYCEGGSVGDILKSTDRPFSEDIIALICREALRGLKYMHEKHKIHRDIKGGNILLSSDGRVKLADFGVSAVLHSTFAKRNTFAGTPYWMAPEVILENEYDGRADIWSLGITAIEMAELNPPFADVHPWRVLFKIPKEPPPVLAERRKWTSNFHDFLNLCLRKAPTRRPTADQLLQHAFVANCKPKVLLKKLVEDAKKYQSGPTPRDSDDEDRKYSTVNEDNDTVISRTGAAISSSGTLSGGGTTKTVRSGTNAPQSNLGIQNEFQRIYRQGCTIQVPWLQLSSVSPITLLTPMTEDEIRSSLNELSLNAVPADAPVREMDPIITNLLKTYAYNRHKQAHVPMTEQQADLTEKTVNELSTALKTILRI